MKREQNSPFSFCSVMCLLVLGRSVSVDPQHAGSSNRKRGVTLSNDHSEILPKYLCSSSVYWTFWSGHSLPKELYKVFYSVDHSRNGCCIYTLKHPIDAEFVNTVEMDLIQIVSTWWETCCYLKGSVYELCCYCLNELIIQACLMRGWGFRFRSIACIVPYSIPRTAEQLQDSLK